MVLTTGNAPLPKLSSVVWSEDTCSLAVHRKIPKGLLIGTAAECEWSNNPGCLSSGVMIKFKSGSLGKNHGCAAHEGSKGGSDPTKDDENTNL